MWLVASDCLTLLHFPCLPFLHCLAWDFEPEQFQLAGGMMIPGRSPP